MMSSDCGANQLPTAMDSVCVPATPASLKVRGAALTPETSGTTTLGRAPLAENGVRGKGRQPLSPHQRTLTRSAKSAPILDLIVVAEGFEELPSTFRPPKSSLD